MIRSLCQSLVGSALLLALAVPNVLAQTTTASDDTLDVHEKRVLDRITVIGTPVWQSTIPGAATYIGPVQLAKQNHTDIHRILRTVSGVYLQEEDGYGLRPNIGIRGAGGERSSKINLMEDGVLAAPAPYSAPAAYYFPTVGRMNAIEVRKGSSQIKYGPNTTGGTVNLISTPIPVTRSGRVELSAGERASNRLYANFGNRTERLGYLVEAIQIGDDGFKELDNGGRTGFRVQDVLGKFMIRSASDAAVYQRLELKAGYHEEVSDETYLGISREDFVTTPYRRYAASQVDQMNTKHTQLMARHFVQFSDRVDLTSTLYRNDFSREWYKLNNLDASLPGVSTGNLYTILSDPSTYALEYGYLTGQGSSDDALIVRNNNRKYFSQGIESILGLNFTIGNFVNELEAGVRLHQDQEDRFQHDDRYRMDNMQMVRTTQGVPGTQDNRIGSATALSLFIQDEIRVSDWTFTPGVRYENIWFRNRNYGGADLDRTGANLNENEYVTHVLVPGIGVSWQATDALTLLGGVHRGFSPPSPGSSSETKSELSLNYELGFRYDRSSFRAEVIGFYNDYTNLLGSDLAAGGGTGTTAQFNAGGVEIYGLEVAADLDLKELLKIESALFSAIPLHANYTWTQAEFLTSFQSNFGPWGAVQKGDRIPFIPEHQLNAGLEFQMNRFQAGVDFNWQPRMRTSAGSGAIDKLRSTDSWFLTDLSGSYTLLQDVTLFVNVRNLFDATYIVSDRPGGVRPGLPRTVMGGLRVGI